MHGYPPRTKTPICKLTHSSGQGVTRSLLRKVSGVATKRPKLDKLLSSIRKGDTLTVYRLDRVGRSISHLTKVIHELEAKGAGFRSLHETIDTTTANGKLIFNMFAALIEFERDLLRERTLAGLSAARKRGARIGRPVALTKPQVQHAEKLIAGGESPAAVARSLKVDPSTLYRARVKLA